MASEKKLRILCLHGYRQNAESFRDKMGGFRKSVKNIAELVFLNAPHEILKTVDDLPAPDNEKVGLSWWFCDETNNFNAKTACEFSEGFRDSIEVVSNAFRNQGPFDGLLGFSQGGALVSLICGLKERQEFLHDFHFVMIVAGFRSISQSHQCLYEKPLNTKSLHVIGKADTCISKELGDDLVSVFHDPTVIYHDGGHFLPTNSSIKSQYLMFFKNVLNEIINHD